MRVMCAQVSLTNWKMLAVGPLRGDVRNFEASRVRARFDPPAALFWLPYIVALFISANILPAQFKVLSWRLKLPPYQSLNGRREIILSKVRPVFRFDSIRFDFGSRSLGRSGMPFPRFVNIARLWARHCTLAFLIR
jgi:hypothetical protein